MDNFEEKTGIISDKIGCSDQDDQGILSAIKECDVRKVTQFLSASGDPSLLFLPDGISPMHIAAGINGKHAFDILKLLLMCGGNPNVRSFEGLTPVHVSSAWGRRSQLKLLLKYGGDPHVRDDEGNDAFSFAKNNDQHKALLILERQLVSSETNKAISLNVQKRGQCLNAYSTIDSAICKSKKDLTNYITQEKQKDNEPRLQGDSNVPINLEKQSYEEENDIDHSWYTVNEVLHLNDKENVAMLEQHWIPCDASGTISENSFYTAATQSAANETLKSLSSSILQLNDEELINKLKSYNETPGPITSSTRRVYLRRLTKLRNERPAVNCNFLKMDAKSLEYSSDLKNFIELKQDISAWSSIEDGFLLEFNNLNRQQTWRGGLHKSYFNYFLLDPRTVQNLSRRVSSFTLNECFSVFVKSIFYIGKGKNSRSYDHLCDALKALKNPQGKTTKKIERILDIWKSDFGVISLHCFHSSVAVEAFTREACMIEAIGVNCLTNLKRGELYGQVKTWPGRDRCRLGIIFLFRAFQIFLQEGEKQIRPFNI